MIAPNRQFNDPLALRACLPALGSGKVPNLLCGVVLLTGIIWMSTLTAVNTGLNPTIVAP